MRKLLLVLLAISCLFLQSCEFPSLSFQIGITTVDLTLPVCILLIALFAILIIGLYIITLSKRMVTYYRLGKYKKVVFFGKQVRLFYKIVGERKSDVKNWENLHLYLAVSQLALENAPSFLQTIEEVWLLKNEKAFWKSIYYLKQGDTEKARGLYDKIEDSDQYHTQRALLEGFLILQSGNIEEGRKALAEVYPKLQSLFLQRYVNETLQIVDAKEERFCEPHS